MDKNYRVYEFGDFILEAEQRRLLRLDSGESIAMTAKVFDTLLYLVEHRGETLDKDTLLQAIWPDVIVEENSLTQNISTLRQILGEGRGENRYIATVPRKGYRFVANVIKRDVLAEKRTVSAPAAPTLVDSRRSRWPAWVVAAVLVVLVASGYFFLRRGEIDHSAALTTQTLAVLPFKPLLPSERDESLELGMTESLISSLGQGGSGAITPLSSVRRYSAIDQDALAAGRALKVKTVLEGSLQRSGDRLRVSARLLRVADGQQLWAQNFDQNFTTIFEVQDVIAAQVAQALSMHRSGEGSAPGAPYTKDPEAYVLYVRGHYAWSRPTEANLLRAIELFQQAIARDRNYALAYSGLADCYALLAVYGIRAPTEVFPKSRNAVLQALAIDPNLAAAHSALGHIKVQFDRDWDGAAQEYARAKQLDPRAALTYQRLGHLYALQGDLDKALAASDRAQQLEPLWLGAKATPGNYLYFARRYDESIRILDQVLTLDDRLDIARGWLIRSLIGKGDYDRALKEYDKGPIRSPGSNAFRAQALALSGRREAALAELERVLKLSKERYVAAYDIALIYVALADTENAFLWLGRAMEDRSTGIGQLAQDSAFDGLHGDPRFTALVQRIGINRRVLPEN